MYVLDIEEDVLYDNQLLLCISRASLLCSSIHRAFACFKLIPTSRHRRICFGWSKSSAHRCRACLNVEIYSDGSFALHATLSTADLTLSATSVEAALCSKNTTTTAGRARLGQMPPFVQTDNFLFSDEEEGADTVVFPKLAVEEPDVVPDSSDEASTGPPLEMELDGDSDRDGRDSFTDVIQGDVNGYAHLEARSRTEEGLFTRSSCCVIETWKADSSAHMNVFMNICSLQSKTNRSRIQSTHCRPSRSRVKAEDSQCQQYTPGT